MVEIEQKRYADDITTQELVRLRVENERLREQERKMTNHALERMEEIERLREALQDLMAVQNGPPLATYTDAWNAAMKKADAALQQKESE